MSRSWSREVREDEEQYLETLRRRVRKLKGFLTTAPENRGAKARCGRAT